MCICTRGERTRKKEGYCLLHNLWLRTATFRFQRRQSEVKPELPRNYPVLAYSTKAAPIPITGFTSATDGPLSADVPSYTSLLSIIKLCHHLSLLPFPLTSL